MTDEPIDLDAERKGHPQHHELHYCRKCGERWPCMQVRSLDEIERLRTELADEQRLHALAAEQVKILGVESNALQARLDAAVRVFEAHDTNYEGWALDCLGEVMAALTREAS